MFPSSTFTACLHALQIWMMNNYLKFKSCMTELLLTGSNYVLCSIPIAETTIPVSTQFRSLGVMLDSTLSSLNKVYCIALLGLRNISTLCPTLTQHSTEVLVNALVPSRIDYCNAILEDIHNKLLHQLQLIQNSAVQIIIFMNCIQNPLNVSPPWWFNYIGSLCHNGLTLKVYYQHLKVFIMYSPFISRPPLELHSVIPVIISRASTSAQWVPGSCRMLHPNYGSHFPLTSIYWTPQQNSNVSLYSL